MSRQGQVDEDKGNQVPSWGEYPGTEADLQWPRFTGQRLILWHAGESALGRVSVAPSEWWHRWVACNHACSLAEECP